jgi:uncharacterized Zn-finger protein
MEKAHKCATCGKEFARTDGLTKHMRLHTGVTPYKCEVCGEEFVQSDELRNHTSKHTGVFKYQCDEDDCNYKTNHVAQLKRHVYTHTGKKPHKCHVCGNGFSRKGNMNRHVKRFHTTKER